MRRLPVLLMTPPLLLLLLVLLILLVGSRPAAGASSSPADDLLQTLLGARGRQGRSQRLGWPEQQQLGDTERRLLHALLDDQAGDQQRAYGSVTSKVRAAPVTGIICPMQQGRGVGTYSVGRA